MCDEGGYVLIKVYYWIMRNIRLYFGFKVINLIKCFLNIGYFYDKLLIYIICDLNI